LKKAARSHKYRHQFCSVAEVWNLCITRVCLKIRLSLEMGENGTSAGSTVSEWSDIEVDFDHVRKRRPDSPRTIEGVTIMSFFKALNTLWLNWDELERHVRYKKRVAEPCLSGKPGEIIKPDWSERKVKVEQTDQKRFFGTYQSEFVDRHTQNRLLFPRLWIWWKFSRSLKEINFLIVFFFIIF